jgi:ATP/ADP translocase
MGTSQEYMSELETSLKSQASDWLKWQLEMFYGLVSMFSFITLGTVFLEMAS